MDAKYLPETDREVMFYNELKRLMFTNKYIKETLKSKDKTIASLYDHLNTAKQQHAQDIELYKIIVEQLKEIQQLKEEL